MHIKIVFPLRVEILFTLHVKRVHPRGGLLGGTECRVLSDSLDNEENCRVNVTESRSAPLRLKPLWLLLGPKTSSSCSTNVLYPSIITIKGARRAPQSSACTVTYLIPAAYELHVLTTCTCCVLCARRVGTENWLLQNCLYTDGPGSL